MLRQALALVVIGGLLFTPVSGEDAVSFRMTGNRTARPASQPGAMERPAVTPPPIDCTNPWYIEIYSFPVITDPQSTCGVGNDYSNTCLGYYDGGEEMIYEIFIPFEVCMDVILHPHGTSWTGMALAQDCPPVNCIAVSTNSGSGDHGFDCLNLSAGSYYLMVDTWPSPDCIPLFEIEFRECGEWVYCPPDGISEDEICGDDINGGCNSDPPVFSTIECGQTVCGELWADDGWRDTDWWQVEINEPTQIVFEAVAVPSIVIGLVETDPPGSGDCADNTGYLNPYAMGPGFTIIDFSTTLTPGIYWLFVATQEYDGWSCPYEVPYVASLECVPDTPAYCEAAGGCGSYISRVSVGSIDVASECSGYADYASHSTQMQPAESYQIIVEAVGAVPSVPCNVWVDWDQDKVFASGENVTLDIVTGVSRYQGILTVPMVAAETAVRLRIRLGPGGPCGVMPTGEVEDYTVEIAVGPSMVIAPDTVYAAYAYAVPPMEGTICLGGSFSGDVNDIDTGTLLVNDSILPSAVDIIDDHPQLPGEALQVTFAMTPFVAGYLPVYGIGEAAYSLTGEFNDGTPFAKTGSVTFVGHLPGDMNLDGQVNIIDLTSIVGYLFTGGDPPIVPELGDVNGDCLCNIVDVTYLVAYLFDGGPAPVPCE